MDFQTFLTFTDSHRLNAVSASAFADNFSSQSLKKNIRVEVCKNIRL